MADKRSRKPNFSQVEVNVLVDLVSEDIERIRGKVSPSLTWEVKNKIWDKIAQAVNACGCFKRSVDDVRNKWSCLLKDANKAYVAQKAERMRTGGGPPPKELKEIYSRVLDVCSNTKLNGVEGGLETGNASEEAQVQSQVDNSTPELEFSVERCMEALNDPAFELLILPGEQSASTPHVFSGQASGQSNSLDCIHEPSSSNLAAEQASVQSLNCVNEPSIISVGRASVQKKKKRAPANLHAEVLEIEKVNGLRRGRLLELKIEEIEKNREFQREFRLKKMRVLELKERVLKGQLEEQDRAKHNV